MRIERSGSRSNHGTRAVEASLAIKWDSTNDGVKLSAWRVSDFNTPAMHDYDFRLGGGEVASIVTALSAAAARGEASAVIERLSVQVPALLRLASICLERRTEQS
jgi:hypothetical protein